MGRRMEVLAWNALAAAVVTHPMYPGEEAQLHANTPHRPAVRTLCADWKSVACTGIAQLRRKRPSTRRLTSERPRR
ncbi:hypothetical protein [Streptomyces sp. NPDC014995]|uniref:MmyB family transcriptional regulator n=1 Tax=Streptomyces sp. NPDC014995 TaxID=3364936 RepID=UPI00370339F5